MLKECTNCKVIKNFSEFHKNSRTKDGLNFWCKSCKKEYNKNRSKENKNKFIKKPKKCNQCDVVKNWIEFHKCSLSKDGLHFQCKSCCKKYQKEYYQKNRKKILANNKIYHQEHREEILANNKIYHQEHREEILEQQKIYSLEHKEEKAEYDREYQKIRTQEDINYKIARNLRKRLNIALKNNQKSGSAVNDLGCSIEEFKLYIEHQFQPGMTWDNYGEWHLDHVMPLSSFDLTNRMELLEACNWLNIRPLWASDNLSKGAKIQYGN